MILVLAELFRAESKSQVYGVSTSFCLTMPMWQLISVSFIATCSINNYYFWQSIFCYDDGCHLRRYARNDCRKEISTVTQQLADIEIVVDKLHMRGHTDEWCQRNCDPNLFAELNDVSKLADNTDQGRIHKVQACK